MNESYLVPLGKGLVVEPGFSGKAARLDQAKTAGLAVPDGYLLTEEAARDAERTGLIEPDSERIHVDDLSALIALLDLPKLPEHVAVRSAFAAEDRQSESLAGFFVTRLDVDSSSPSALANALADVWCSAGQAARTSRRDVLIQGMVASRYAGVAFTERSFEDDRINYTWGTAERLGSGKEAGLALELPRLRRWERPASNRDLPGFATRLQRLLRDVRTVFGQGDWNVEWADDGAVCWLLQVRPITRPLRRNEAFVLATHRDVLPRLPSRFMTSVMAASGEHLFDYFRDLDPSLPTGRRFVEIFRERPYMNLSLMQDMVRRWGLPTRMVTRLCGVSPDVDTPVNAGRLVRNLPVLVRLARNRFLVLRDTEKGIQSIREQAADPGTSFPEILATFQRMYVSMGRRLFGLGAALRGPVAMLRRLHALDVHPFGHDSASTSLYADLDLLRTWLAQHPEVKQELARGELPTHPDFETYWKAYLDLHGHRGLYESDIARPRYHEEPEPLLRSLAGEMPKPDRRQRYGLWGWITWPFWLRARRALRARERLRSEAMRGFDAVRGALIARWHTLCPDLPQDVLWLLDLEEVRMLESGWRPGAELVERLRGQRERMLAYRMPDLLHRFDDLEVTARSEVAREEHATLSGMSLTDGSAHGRAWVLDEPSADLPEGFDAAETILVTRSVDSSWFPIFTAVAGVVVERGGDLSHGSILLRELGVPAITNAAGATSLFRTGDVLELGAGEGIVRRV